MRYPFRAFALACVLSTAPACAHLPSFENPVAAAERADQQAYALLRTYAAIVETAAVIVADPNTPAALRRALAHAERAATPAAETLGLAVRAYVSARVDLEAAPSDNAAIAVAIAANRLSEALQAAQTPIDELEALVRTRRG
jgi:hypothetical protein